MTKLVAAAAFLALNAYVYHFLATQAVIPSRERFDTFPRQIGESWSCVGEPEISDDVKRNLGVTDYLFCNFVSPEYRIPVGVYVGYHQTQVREEGGGAGENSIHPPAHCLPGSGWDVIQNDKVSIGFAGLPEPDAQVRRLVIARNEDRALVYYWYQSRNRVISDDWKKILFLGWDRATRGRTDGSLVRFTIPIFDERDGGEERSEAMFRSLAPLVVSRLPEYVPN